MEAATRPLGFEQRESVKVLVVVRWVVLGALLLLIDYPLRASPRATLFVGAIIGAALVLNGLFQWLLASRRPVPLWVPLGVGMFDAAAITGAIMAFDGFDNGGYVLYYPALMGFAALFPGRIGITYCLTIMGVYSVLSLTAYKAFDTSTAADWHDLGLRLITMMAAVLMAYLLVRVERQRRLRAVAAEAARHRELIAVEERAREIERRTEQERQRMVRDLHDGVSQGVYMLSLGIEGAAHRISLKGDGGQELEQIEALVRLSKRTLLEARGLLFDLGGVMGGDRRLDALLRHQAEEFRAVTGIAVTLSVEGETSPLPAATVGEVYRVVQESLANVYRHAGARSVQIALREEAAGTKLTISDDGAGFSPDEAQGRGHGLRTMRERSALIGADLELRSVPGVGSCVTLTIPAPTPGGVCRE